MFGFLVINKPKGISSRAALNGVSRQLGKDSRGKRIRIGHAGTLDPMATGVLVSCIGPATRLVSYVQNMPKKYIADFRLGFISDTEDVEGELIPVADPPAISRAEMQAVLPSFLGTISQLPPKFSALKINGKRAYQLAREGKDVKLAARPVEIIELRLASFSYPDFRLEIACGSGTYVRSLGRDIGVALGTGAVMTDLHRSSIGIFDESLALESAEPSYEQCVKQMIPPLQGVAQLPTATLNPAEISGLNNGTPVSLPSRTEIKEIAAIDEQNRLLAILRPKKQSLFTPALNFVPYWNSADAN